MKQLIKAMFEAPSNATQGMLKYLYLWTTGISLVGSMLLLFIATKLIDYNIQDIAVGIPAIWALCIPVIAFGGWINYQMQKEDFD